jgi:hypothetical protein
MPFHPVDRKGKNTREEGTPFEHDRDPMIKRETLELVRAYYKIPEPRVRRRLFETVKAPGAASHAEALTGKKRRAKPD